MRGGRRRSDRSSRRTRRRTSTANSSRNAAEIIKLVVFGDTDMVQLVTLLKDTALVSNRGIGIAHEVDGPELSAAVEGVVLQRINLRRDGDGLQAGAAIECVVHDPGNVDGKSHIVQVLAAREGVSADAGHGIRDDDALQTAALLEHGLLDGFDTVGDGDALKSGRILEAAVGQLSDALLENDLNQVIAVSEAVLTQNGHIIRGGVGSVLETRGESKQSSTVLREQDAVLSLEGRIALSNSKRGQLGAATECTVSHVGQGSRKRNGRKIDAESKGVGSDFLDFGKIKTLQTAAVEESVFLDQSNRICEFDGFQVDTISKRIVTNRSNTISDRNFLDFLVIRIPIRSLILVVILKHITSSSDSHNALFI